jgi:hypothetical protein
MQAFKVWWSYSWRASILVIPVALIMTAWSLAGILPALENMLQTGQTPDVDQLMRLASGGTLLMVLSLIIIAAVQVLAMRWALNSSWSDFRLKAVPPNAQARGQPGPGDSGRPARV